MLFLVERWSLGVFQALLHFSLTIQGLRAVRGRQGVIRSAVRCSIQNSILSLCLDSKGGGSGDPFLMSTRQCEVR
jgi:hypothetical protein